MAKPVNAVTIRAAKRDDARQMRQLFRARWPAKSGHSSHIRGLVTAFRRQGVGGSLVVAAEEWCRAQGCREVASDTWANHPLSVAVHQGLGHEVDGRYINFRKSL